MIMWSNNYPTYIPAPMLCHSSPGYPRYDYLVPVFFDDYDYPSSSNNNNFAHSPILLDPHPTPYHYHMNYRRAPPHPAPAPYSLQVRLRRATPLRVLPPSPREKRIPAFRNPPHLRVLAAHSNTTSIALRERFDAQVPLQVSKLRNKRRIFRKTKTTRCLEVQTTKRSRHFPTRIPLQASNLPKRRWIRNPFKKGKGKGKRHAPAPTDSSLQVSAFHKRGHTHFPASTFKKGKRHAPAPTDSSLQVPAFHKRGHTHFRASTLKKRKRRVAPTESSLQVSSFRKRSHKFTKWFPLRVSNQWRKRSHRSYACFRCKKQGHFAIRCPQNMMNNKSRLSSSVSVFVGQDGLQYSPPSLICWCGLRCLLTTWKRTSRKVYTCSLRRCKVFRWEDEVNKDELISVPKCGCGAGFCRQCTESGDTEVGRKYFACPIKKGQGACTFFKLLNDESLTNNRHVDERISPLRFTIGNCSDTFPANNVQKESRSHVLDTVEYYPNQREISGNQKVELMQVELECEEDTLNKTPRKCNKRLRDGAPKYDSSFSHSVVEFINVPQSYSKGGDTEGVVHARKIRSTSHSCSYTTDLLPLREEWLMTAAMDLNIELFKGWWGRLAYPPMPCLKLPEPKPIYCCVFPSFDPLFVPQSVAEVDWQSRNCQNPQKILEGSLMFGAISDRFATVARDLQNKLISLLKSSDFRAHDYMNREANITFTALDQLQVQSQPFCKRVNKFIRSASILAKAGSFIISNDQSNNDFKHHYNSKKRKRDDLISDYDVAKADMETCKERLHSLCEEASRQKSMLFQVEARVSSCDAENRYHEARCAQISIDLIESEKHIQVAEEDLRLLQQKKEEYNAAQQKKEEYNAAEAAYKKARIELGIIT